MEKNLQDALAQGNQQEAEEARKILAKETLKLEEKAESEKEKNPKQLSCTFLIYLEGKNLLFKKAG